MILEDAQLTQSKLNTYTYEARIKIHCKAEGCTGKMFLYTVKMILWNISHAFFHSCHPT